VLPEAALAQEAGLCFAALVTVGDLSADRPVVPSSGEVRASLNATLAILPSALKLGMEGECDCRGPHYEAAW
jgi:purine nucleoside phosphorylase